MIRDVRKVKQNLLKKGFIREQGAKHTHYIFVYKGNEICRTYMSRNDQDINDYLIESMGKQVHLDKRDFIKLIDCPLSEKGYIKILKEKDLL